MADKKIYITISSNASGSSVTANQSETTGNINQQQKNNQQKAAGETDDLSKVVKTMLADAGKKIASNAMAQYGNLTGNTIKASRLKAATQIAGYAATIAAGGWVGVVAVAVDVGIQSINQLTEQRKSNAQADLIRQRIGNSTRNGSRDTNG